MNQIVTISLYRREPDWVGAAIVLAIGVALLALYFYNNRKDK